MGHAAEFWQNVTHWRREWQTTSVFLPWELHEKFTSVQSLSRVWPFATPWTAHQASLSIIKTQSLPKLMSLSQWCHPTISSSVLPFSSCLESFPASRSFQMSQLFASGGQSIGSFSFNISPNNEHSEMISFRMDWLDLLVVQGILKSLLQHHSSKASSLRCSVFFKVQFSHPYMTTGKTITLTRRTYVEKVMPLLLIC